MYVLSLPSVSMFVLPRCADWRFCMEAFRHNILVNNTAGVCARWSKEAFIIKSFVNFFANFF